ncbi:MAG TPA: metallophosphoesterase [Verrucomicrobiae bacterium]|nr:metallophosphoesterase [Verrucomicrobiae bacterium]
MTNQDSGADTGFKPTETGPGHNRTERRRLLPFLVVVSTILFSGTWLVCATWEHFGGRPIPTVWRIVPYVLSAAFILSMLAGMRFSGLLLKLTYRVSAVWMALLNFCLFAALACFIVSAASNVFGLGLDRKLIGTTCYGLAILATCYGLVNAAWLRVTRVTVPLPHLPPAWQGREVVLMSDLHLGNIRGAGFTRRVVSKARSLQPHAVFVCGDVFDGPKADYDRLVEPFRALTAPAGVYFITGNHEEFTDRAKFIAAIARAGLRVLNNEKVTVEGLQIVGVHDGEAVESERLREILQDAALDRQQASILLAHRPGNLSIAEAAGVSLQVSGHTHKGQTWPWFWLAYRVHGPFAYGLNRLGNLLVLTSSGAGTWGPPVRVGTKSEIVLIRLEQAAAPV